MHKGTLTKRVFERKYDFEGAKLPANWRWISEEYLGHFFSCLLKKEREFTFKGISL